MEPHTPQNPRRENFLAILLTLLFGGATLVTVIFIGVGIFGSANIFFFLIVGAFAILFVGYLHYVLWGYGLSQDTAAQHEEEQRRRRRELDELERARRGE